MYMIMIRHTSARPKGLKLEEKQINKLKNLQQQHHQQSFNGSSQSASYSTVLGFRCITFITIRIRIRLITGFIIYNIVL